MFLVKFKNFMFIAGLMNAWITSPTTFATTISSSSTPIPYADSPRNLKASIILPTQVQKVSIAPEITQLKKRVLYSKKIPQIEPITLYAEDSYFKIKKLADRIALPNKSKLMNDYLKTRISALSDEGRSSEHSSKAKIELDPKSFDLIDFKKLSIELKKDALSIKIDPQDSPESAIQISKMYKQVSFFLDNQELSNLQQAIDSSSPIDVAEYLLPDFPKSMLEKFSVYRGPNCFHASLAFHSKDLGQSPFFNLRRELNYHPLMINHDELLYTIKSNFYEVDTRTHPLKYGDMIVFFDVEDYSRFEPHYRWIKHASTYLFSNFSFSKASKSADTPYSLKTIDEEWNTWKKYSKNLGVKVFRRSNKNVTTQPPIFLDDWMY